MKTWKGTREDVMTRLLAATIIVGVLAALSTPVAAGTAEQRMALRRTAAWAAETLERDMPAAEKVAASDARRVWLLVVPPGRLSEELRAPLSTAIAGLSGFTEVYPKDEITSFVDETYLHPKEPRYDPETILELGGKFRAAQGLLLVQYRLEERPAGKIDVAVDLALWDARTAEKLWGADRTEVLDTTALSRANELVMSGKIDEALALIEREAASRPEWEVEFERLRANAEKLASHREKLARIRGHIDLNHLDQALEGIEALYEEGDPGLREALLDSLADVRSRIVRHVEAEVEAGQYETARNRIAELRSTYPGDLDLLRFLASLTGRIDAATAPPPKKEPGLLDKATEDPKTLLYVGAGLVAAILIAIVLALSLRKRKDVQRWNRGVEEAKKGASQADLVRESLQKDRDLRKEMLKELDRSEDSLAEANSQAQAQGKTEVATAIQAAAARIQELRRRVKLAPDGDPQEFMKGRLPMSNLEALLGYQRAVAGQIAELTKEAVAAQDSVAAGGSPEKNLKLLTGLAERISGKLAEREGYFAKKA